MKRSAGRILVALAAFAIYSSPARADGASHQDFKELIDWVHWQVPGARVAKLYAVIDPSGSARCWAKGGRFYEGWEMIVQAGTSQWMMMGCRPRKLVKAYLSPFPVVAHDFIGIDEALAALSRAKISFVPDTPIRATLAGPPAKGGDAIWKIENAGRVIQINAYTSELINGAPGAGPRTATTAPRTHRKIRARNSARQHLERVREVARRKLNGMGGGRYALIAIDALTDSQGSTNCTPPSDGWAFYYYAKQLNDFQIIYDCDGDVDLGKSETYIPASPAKNEFLNDKFVDSSEAMAVVATPLPKIVTMRLLKYKTPLVAGHPFVWQIGREPDWHLVDAVTGRYLGKK